MEPKLILRVETEVKSSVKPVFVPTDLMDQLKDIKTETGIPINKLVAKCIEFGLDNLVIQKVEN